MTFTAASLAVVLLAGISVYYLTTLMIWIGHYLPHRPHSRLREFHMGGHHSYYPDSRHTRTDRFHFGTGRNDSLVPQLPWLFALAITLWAILPTGYAVAALLELAAITTLHSYVHMHFHIAGTWLLRYAWFRRAQATHDIHHDRDVNFMVADHFWDRALGTFENPGDRS